MSDSVDKFDRAAVEAILRESLDDMMGILAEVVMDRVSQRYPGQRVYVPVNTDGMTRQEREMVIRREFDGTNMREVCRRHKISRSAFYRIIGKA